MRVFRDPDEGRFGRHLTAFVIGTLGGLALGILLSRRRGQPSAIGAEFRDRAKTVARRLRPGRLRRLAEDQEILDQLEDAVLRAFLQDEVLGERAIDIGAISYGIVELSGTVWSESEAEQAVSLANMTEAVRTVVNRLEIEEQTRRGGWRQKLSREDLDSTFQHQEGRTGGMGRRRQSSETDPDRPDDSQARRGDALAAADRDQFEDEDLAYRNPRQSERPGSGDLAPTRFEEDELDNQDPHLKRRPTREALNSDVRVGEGMDPGTRRTIESADLPVEPPSSPDSEG
ncbi:MAG: BON domain-containing protein [Gemmatimonas sp.]|nr:BON domain-containing protein [Gemmatimonas sp.]